MIHINIASAFQLECINILMNTLKIGSRSYSRKVRYAERKIFSGKFSQNRVIYTHIYALLFAVLYVPESNMPPLT
ncbi:hypothetical protein AgCh_038344 [Apium graveolens]